MVKLKDKGAIPIFGDEKIEQLKAEIATWQSELAESRQSLEEAKDRVIDIRASWKSGSKEFTAADKQEADAEVERLGLAINGLEGRIKHAEDKLPQMDTRHAEGVARLIHEAYSGTIAVEVQAGKFNRKLVKATDGPVVVVTPQQGKHDVPKGEAVILGKSRIYLIRGEMDAPFKTHLLTAAAQRHNLRYRALVNLSDRDISDSDASVFMPKDAAGVNADVEVVEEGYLHGTVLPNIDSVTEVEASIFERWAQQFVQGMASEATGSVISADDFKWAQSATQLEYQRIEDGVLRFRVKTYACIEGPGWGRPSRLDRYRSSVSSARHNGHYAPGIGHLRKGFKMSVVSDGDEYVKTYIEGEIVADPTA